MHTVKQLLKASVMDLSASILYWPKYVLNHLIVLWPVMAPFIGLLCLFSLLLLEVAGQIVFISLWKNARALVRPKERTWNSYNPLWVMNAVLWAFKPAILSWWYPDCRSREDEICAPCSLSIRSSILGRGSVFDSDLTQCFVVDAHSHGAIFLSHKYNWRAVWRANGLNPILSKVIFDHRLSFKLFFRR